MKKQIISLVAIAITFASCENNDEDTLATLEVPTTYTFERDNQTTVSYSGQTNRLLMLDEMGAYIKTQATNGGIVETSTLNNMYANTNGPFLNEDLNSASNQLKNKTAVSMDYFELFFGDGSTTEQFELRTFFENQFTDANLASNGSNASAGVAGSYLDGSSTRLFAANGLEPQQVILKGLMGAVAMDQMVNNYLSINKLDGGSNVSDNTNKVLVSGKNYTNMEHFWDEGYGYLYGIDNGTDDYKFWSEYIRSVNADSDFNTVKADIDRAFIKGRAAIVANEYSIRDEQIDIIKEKLALVNAVKAVYYLQSGKSKLATDNGAKAFHAISEAYGFIMSLRFSNKPNTDHPYFSKTEIETMLNDLVSGTNGLWDVDTLEPKLDAISTQIAAPFGFTVEQAAISN